MIWKPDFKKTKQTDTNMRASQGDCATSGGLAICPPIRGGGQEGREIQKMLGETFSQKHLL